MNWTLRSRPAYIGDYENEYPIPLVADSQEYIKMSTLPPKHKPGLANPERVVTAVNKLMTAVNQGKPEAERKKLAQDWRDEMARSRELGLTAYTRKKVDLSGKGRRKTYRAKGNGSIVVAMMTIRDQIKVYHWQTKSFARHEATDEFVTELDRLIDSFVEVYMGKYGRPKVSGSIKLHNFSESAAKSFVTKQTAYLSKVLPRKLKSTDTDLLNIRDEILGLVNKTLYLFTLQ
jgi:hypothetical protein